MESMQTIPEAKTEREYYSPEEKKEIVKRYRRILRSAKSTMNDGDAKMIKKALGVSMEAHKEMRRKSGEPYIYHPLEVALICVEEIGLGTTSIICALLHDVVEDTSMTLADIEKGFGPKVAQIIDGLTKISENFEQSQSAQAENFRKMLLTLSKDDAINGFKSSSFISTANRNKVDSRMMISANLSLFIPF